MSRRTAAAAVVEVLLQEGVTHVFGLIGTAVLDLLDEIHGAELITYVGVRHEQNAVHMADAYARVSGRPGVVIAGQPGPGYTNTTTGIAQAKMAFSPVVVIAGDTDSVYFEKGTFQEIDQQAVMAPLTKHIVTVRRPDRIGDHVRNAFRVAQSGRMGPVVVNVPGDVFGVDVDLATTHDTAAISIPVPGPSRSAVSEALALLNDAKRPLIIAGAGVKWSRASKQLIELAERANIPIAASAGNGDVVPNDHVLFRGQVGPRGNQVATKMARDADVILALGTRLAFNTTFFSNDNLSGTARIIHVDIEPTAVARHFPVSVGVVADAGEMIAALLPDVGSNTDRGAWINESAGEYRALIAERVARVSGATAPFHPVAAIGAIQEALPRNAIVTIDTGTISLAATDVIRTFEPPALLTPLDFGLVGFSYAAGLGAKVAAPDRPVVSIIGDGGFGMTMGEIGTAIMAGIPTITVVLNNGSWGAEKAYQRDFYGSRFVGADLVSPRFDEVARSFGAVGHRAETTEAITKAITESLDSDLPVVIEAQIDPATMQAFRRALFAAKAGRSQPGPG